MFQELEKVVQRYNDLTQRLSEQGLTKNPDEFKKVGKEHSDLKPIVESYQKYKELKQQLDDNKKIIETESDADIREMASEEIPEIENKLEKIEEELKLLLLPKDPRDDKNVILEIRAGTGGDEAALFGADLFRMYQRYAELRRWKLEILSNSPTGKGGFKEIIASISGDKVFSYMKYESGVHRVQRVPETEASGRIHTSAATVVVLPEADEIDISIDPKDLRIDVFRSSGPGGQSVNTTDSAVRVTYIPTNLVVICQDEKSQHKNKAKALKVLRSRLYEQALEEEEKKMSSERRAMVSTGDRSAKIRTYNFPQNRVTDHRIGLSLHNLSAIMEGELDTLIDHMRAHFQALALKGNDE
ncbi:MAG: peptide chain release factor 1 [Pseudomonadota bacterium]